MSEPKGGGTWIKVDDVKTSDTFNIVDEIKSGRGKYETEGCASGMIKRKSDGKLFMKTFKPMELEKLADNYGEDSKKWVGKAFGLVRLTSKKWDKEYLALNVEIDLDEETPF
jgi:hypothetical protein